MPANASVISIKIFLKSGNTIVLDGVEEYGSSGRGGSIAGIRIKQQGLPSQTWLDVESLDLNSVEAIVRLPVEPAQAMETEGGDRRAPGEA